MSKGKRPGALTTLNTERQSPSGKTATGGFPAQNVASCSKEWLLPSSSFFSAAVSLKRRKDGKGRLLGNLRLESSLERRWLQERAGVRGAVGLPVLPKAARSQLGPRWDRNWPFPTSPGDWAADGEDD